MWFFLTHGSLRMLTLKPLKSTRCNLSCKGCVFSFMKGKEPNCQRRIVHLKALLEWRGVRSKTKKNPIELSKDLMLLSNSEYLGSSPTVPAGLSCTMAWCAIITLQSWFLHKRHRIGHHTLVPETKMPPLTYASLITLKTKSFHHWCKKTYISDHSNPLLTGLGSMSKCLDHESTSAKRQVENAVNGFSDRKQAVA